MTHARLMLAGTTAIAILAPVLLLEGRLSPAPELPTPVESAGAAPEVDRERLAAWAVERVELLRAGQGPSELRLDSDELTALVAGALPGLVPVGVHDPEVRLLDGIVTVRALIEARRWAGAERLAPLLPLLPDTLEAELQGRLRQRGRSVVYQVLGARALGVALPDGLVEELVAELPGGASRDATGDAAPTVRLRLPRGIAGIDVVGEHLILRAVEPILDRAVDGDGDP